MEGVEPGAGKEQICHRIWELSGASSSPVQRGLEEVYSNLYPSKG